MVAVGHNVCPHVCTELSAGEQCLLHLHAAEMVCLGHASPALCEPLGVPAAAAPSNSAENLHRLQTCCIWLSVPASDNPASLRQKASCQPAAQLARLKSWPGSSIAKLRQKVSSAAGGDTGGTTAPGRTGQQTCRKSTSVAGAAPVVVAETAQALLFHPAESWQASWNSTCPTQLCCCRSSTWGS